MKLSIGLVSLCPTGAFAQTVSEAVSLSHAINLEGVKAVAGINNTLQVGAGVPSEEAIISRSVAANAQLMLAHFETVMMLANLYPRMTSAADKTRVLNFLKASINEAKSVNDAEFVPMNLDISRVWSSALLSEITNLRDTLQRMNGLLTPYAQPQ